MIWLNIWINETVLIKVLNMCLDSGKMSLLVLLDLCAAFDMVELTIQYYKTDWKLGWTLRDSPEVV